MASKMTPGTPMSPAHSPSPLMTQREATNQTTIRNWEDGNPEGNRRLGRSKVNPAPGINLEDQESSSKHKTPSKVVEVLKDFSTVMHEYRLFYVKMPTGLLVNEVFSINKPLAQLKDKLCQAYEVENSENYDLYLEGACLSTLREAETGIDTERVSRTGLNFHQDTFPDQGMESVLLKTNLSFRMQGVTTSRILALRSHEQDDDAASFMSDILYASDPLNQQHEFLKSWISIVQGNLPCPQEYAIRLAALHYQAYYLDRTAPNSTVGFCSPTDFLPIEYSSVDEVETLMYLEQRDLSKKSHEQIERAYIMLCTQLKTHGAVFFLAREPHKKRLHGVKLKHILIGVSATGILRVDSVTNELLTFWSYNVLKNWAYSMNSVAFVFTSQRFAVECNQAKWVCSLVDFFMESSIKQLESSDF